MITPYPEEDEDIDEYKEKNVYLLINGALQGAEFDEHTVNFMKVPCNESRVEIYEEVLNNDTFDEKEASAVQKVLENKSMNRRKLLKQHPELAEELAKIMEHMDWRSHDIVYRKCDPRDNYQCQHCRESLWNTLPRRHQGGLVLAPS